MIGFIKGIFGSKQPSEAPQVQQPEAPVATQKPVAFFLEADEAQTLGNVEYMRTSKTVKRTFPKTLSGEEKKTLLEISAMKRADLARKQAQIADTLPIAEAAKSATPEVDETAERRRIDTSMDMFRSMAKGLKKP